MPGCSSWVTSRIVWPRRFRSSRSASAISPLRRSRAPVGSSASRTAGRLTTARAIASRWRSPPLSVAGNFRRCSAEARAGRASRRPGASASPRDRPASSAGDGHVLADGQVVEQVEELEDEADVRAAEPGGSRLAEPVDADAVDRDLALRRPVEAADEVEQRRLAAAGRAHDRGDAAGLDVEIDAHRAPEPKHRRSACRPPQA